MLLEEFGEEILMAKSGAMLEGEPRRAVVCKMDGAAPATAANYGIFYTHTQADPVRVEFITGRHETAGNDAGAVTLAIHKVASAAAKSAGATVHSSTYNLKGTADTNASLAVLTTSAAVLNQGDSLAAILTGTPTTIAGLCVTVGLKQE